MAHLVGRHDGGLNLDLITHWHFIPPGEGVQAALSVYFPTPEVWSDGVAEPFLRLYDAEAVLLNAYLHTQARAHVGEPASGLAPDAGGDTDRDDDTLMVEPTFVLRAQDTFATRTIQAWLLAAQRNGVCAEKIESARRVQRAMWKWQDAHGCKLPD